MGDRSSGVFPTFRKELAREILRILKHMPQDCCSLQQYHPALSASVRRICSQLVVWDNLRSQIFHRNKIDARGSIRKAPNVISWTSSLDKMRDAGDKDPSAIIKAWHAELSKQHQIQGAMAQALKNVTGLLPTNISTTIVLPAVSELGWEKCLWSDDTFFQQAHLPGCRAACKRRWLKEAPDSE